MKERGPIREEAFQLYASGVPMIDIAIKLNLGRKTLYEWADRFNWEKRLGELISKQQKDFEQQFIQVRTEQIALGRAMSKLLAHSINVEINKIAKDSTYIPYFKATDMIKAMELVKDWFQPVAKTREGDAGDPYLDPIKIAELAHEAANNPSPTGTANIQPVDTR